MRAQLRSQVDQGRIRFPSNNPASASFTSSAIRYSFCTTRIRKSVSEPGFQCRAINCFVIRKSFNFDMPGTLRPPRIVLLHSTEDRVESSSRRTLRHDCENCWIRNLETFRILASGARIVSEFKSGQLSVEPGPRCSAKAPTALIFTRSSQAGAFATRSSKSGRRQVLNYVSHRRPARSSGTLMGEMQHSVEALSPLELCVFERERLGTLFRDHPGLAFDLTWIAGAKSAFSTNICSASVAAAPSNAPPICWRFSLTKRGSAGLADTRLIQSAGHPTACCRHFGPVDRSHQQRRCGSSLIAASFAGWSEAAKSSTRRNSRGSRIGVRPFPRRRPFI